MGDDGGVVSESKEPESGKARDQVAALLAAAGLDPPDEEVDRLAGLYPALRRSLDRYHTIDADDEVAAAVFRAAEVTGESR